MDDQRRDEDTRRGCDEHAVGLGRIEQRSRVVAGHEQRQLEKVAAIERQRFDPCRGQDTVDRRGQWPRFSANLDRFLHTADLELDAQHLVLTDQQRHRVGPPRGKPAQLHLDAILAR